MALDAVGIDNVMREYDRFADDHTHYAVFEKQGNVLKFSYCGDDAAKGRSNLLQRLESWAQSRTTAQFIIRFYEDLTAERKLDHKTPHAGSFMFKVQEAEPYQGSGSGSNEFVAYLQRQLLEKEDTIRELRDQIADLEDEIAETNEATQEPTGDTGELGFIGLIGRAGQQYPWMQRHIGKLVDTVGDGLGSILNQPGTNETMSRAQQHQNIAGIDNPAETINNAIQNLGQWYIKEEGSEAAGMEAMARDMKLLSDMTKQSFILKMALGQLRKMA